MTVCRGVLVLPFSRLFLLVFPIFSRIFRFSLFLVAIKNVRKRPQKLQNVYRTIKNVKTLPITKTRKRRKITYVESDWRDYYGSNKHLNEEVEQHGKDFYHREILHLCKTKGECAYMETKEQFDREVLLKDEYYNGIINCRIGAKSLKNLFTND